MLNASVISLVTFVYNIFFIPDDFAVTMSVTLSLFFVTMFATLLGTAIPLTFEKFKINPALATGPFIQITNDIIGILIYVYVSSWLLGMFAA